MLLFRAHSFLPPLSFSRLRQRFSLKGYYAALREQHMKRLAGALQALRRKPYHLPTRAACLELAAHKRTPLNHRIFRCRPAFDEQVTTT